MSHDARTAQEFLAVADSLRQARAKLTQLVHDGHLVTRCWPECSVVLCEGLNTARSLEHLAGLLAESAST